MHMGVLPVSSAQTMSRQESTTSSTHSWSIVIGGNSLVAWVGLYS